MRSFADDARASRLADLLIRELAIDLHGLTVITEAASGPYLWTPLVGARAGACVIAVTRDSEYASKEDVRAATLAAAESWGLAARIEVRFGLDPEAVGRADVITNTGFVRPIDRELISWMKSTAVVPLMWETWEYRDADLDLAACREREVLVLGTDESRPTHELYGYGGFIALRLLFDLGLEGYKTRVVLAGGGLGLGVATNDLLTRTGIDVAWFADGEPGAEPYGALPGFLEAHAGEYDALVVAEHRLPLLLLGRTGMVDPVRLAELNPALRVGIISGNIEASRLKESGLAHLPQELRDFGFMSYQAFELGMRPVLELYAAGLKVGEAMARARLAGLSPADAERVALDGSPAMAFPEADA